METGSPPADGNSESLRRMLLGMHGSRVDAEPATAVESFAGIKSMSKPSGYGRSSVFPISRASKQAGKNVVAASGGARATATCKFDANPHPPCTPLDFLKAQLPTRNVVA